MPTYNWLCEPCDRGEEAYVHSFKDSYACSMCEKPMERVWALGVQHRAGSTYPYITTHLNGKPIEVTSSSHLDQLCKQFGVTNRADVAFLEKEYVGLDWKTKKQIYREGSGAGLPGCWI